MTTIDKFQNQFLISLPSLKGDYFQDTISLLVDHNDDGAFGLVINRPVDTTVTEIFPEVEDQFDCPVVEGGPVEQNRVFFLHDTSVELEGTFKIGDELCMTTSREFIDLMANGTAPARCLAVLGYAGWGSRQLEDEIAQDAWLLVPADARIVFDTPFSERPRAAARLLGVDLNLISPAAGHD